MKRAGRQRESGFAMLLVFAMAAAIAVMLYLELPRVAFEAQREKEQLLIERGEQYKRAIQLYFRKFKGYPASLEALENTNNVRYLRKRYVDPMTGKDEWRLIHIGPSGVFTDSLTHSPKKEGKQDEIKNTFITEAQSIGSALPSPDSQRAAGPPRRRGPAAQQGTDGNGLNIAPGGTADPTQQGTNQAPGQTGIPQSAVSAFPGVPANPYDPNAPVDPNTGLPQSPALADGTAAPAPAPTGGVPQPGIDPNQPGGNQAADLIRNLLTRPRPMPGGSGGGGPMGGGPMGGAPMGGMAGTQMTGGIAGVASKLEKPSIKIYNERDQYNEWEFIYDFSKDRTGAGRMMAPVGSNDPRLSQQQPGGQAAGGGLFAGQPGSFGTQPGAGGQTGFGAQPGGTGGFGSSSGSGSQSSSSNASGGIGSGFGGSVGSGFGSQPPPATNQPQQPQQPGNPPQKPTPQPDPTSPAPTPPPEPTNPPPQP